MPASKWLLFSIGEHRFCVEAGRVREVRTIASALITRRQGFALGRFRLRDGGELELIDLKTRLGMGKTALSERMIVIVLSAPAALVGIVVDDGVALVEAQAHTLAESERPDSRLVLGRIDVEGGGALWIDVVGVAQRRAELVAV